MNQPTWILTCHEMDNIFMGYQNLCQDHLKEVVVIQNWETMTLGNLPPPLDLTAYCVEEPT